MPHTFASLAALSTGALEQVLRAGSAPTAEQLSGCEFRGWNQNKSTEILGTRKFIKGFFGAAAAGESWGYNMPVEQDGLDKPWTPRKKNGVETRYAFFKVVPGSRIKDAVYPATLVVDYRLWKRYFFLDPVGYTVDYLVFVEPGNTDLLLGKSYSQFLGIKMYLGYFIIERLRLSGYQGPPEGTP